MLSLREKHEYEQEIAQLKADLVEAKKPSKREVALEQSLKYFKRKCLKLQEELS